MPDPNAPEVSAPDPNAPDPSQPNPHSPERALSEPTQPQPGASPAVAASGRRQPAGSTAAGSTSGRRPSRAPRPARAQRTHRLRPLRRSPRPAPAGRPASRAAADHSNNQAPKDAPAVETQESAAPVGAVIAEAGGPEAAAPDAAAPDAAASEPAGQLPQPLPDHPRGRLWTTFWRPGRGQLIAAVILFVVGMGAVLQVRINTADDTYTTARREDLVQLLDGLGTESRRLEGEIAQLERTHTSLQSGADTQRVARAEAEKRVQVLSILAGTAPAEGPGIRMRIADPAGKVDADVLLNAVEEMRDAGAEVIEINNSVRVVASTWFGTTAKGLVVDGLPVTSPITIEVIGDPHSLAEAANFRGGIVSEITGPPINGQVQIEQLDRVVVESLHALRQTQYAQPASPPPTPR